ncbi:hypothetical protein V6N11_033855 [Hibiscus sabdariffa]|uniref:Uncharacterized protein n=1 Tax=Hibiscus sabdariffa TaxID=183260 RepID=A0ABR2S0S5_9ROSI
MHINHTESTIKGVEEGLSGVVLGSVQVKDKLAPFDGLMLIWFFGGGKSFGTCTNLGQPQQFWHFCFEASWLLESSCEVEVKHLWSSSVGSVPDRLLAVNLGLDRWFMKIRKDKMLIVRALQKRINDLSQ